MAKAGSRKASSKSSKGSKAKKTATKKTSAKKSAAKKTSASTTAAPAASKAAEQESLALENSLLPATTGKIGTFGGPKDRGYKPEDKLALPTGQHFVYERAQSLNPKSFYCAMRWEYRLEHMSPEEGKRWWANKKLTVTNPKTGSAIVVRAVEYGPHENTGLDISVSPAAAEALGVEPGDEVEIAFADQKAALGPAEQ
jgi:hypothetical protein